MSAERVFGELGGDAEVEPALTELELSFVPLDYVAEWGRCGDTADYLARFLAYDFDDRGTAASVLSTVLNELVENVVKFSDDKSALVRFRVRRFADRVRVDARNRTSAARAEAFAGALGELVAGDPETLFARRVADPPDRGGPGIGLVMLRKDYGVTLGVRLTTVPDGGDDADAVDVEVQATIPSREVEQR